MNTDVSLERDNIESSLPSLDFTTFADTITEEELGYLQEDALELKNQNFAQNINLRKLCARYTLIGVGGWLLFVVVVTFCEGFSGNIFYLGSSVLITLFSTTTANVIGTLWIIYRYLFKEGN